MRELPQASGRSRVRRQYQGCALYAALLALLRVSPGARRAGIIERFGKIENLEDAQHFLKEARTAMDAYELSHPSRRGWRPARRKATAGEATSLT